MATPRIPDENTSASENETEDTFSALNSFLANPKALLNASKSLNQTKIDDFVETITKSANLTEGKKSCQASQATFSGAFTIYNAHVKTTMRPEKFVTRTNTILENLQEEEAQAALEPILFPMIYEKINSKKTIQRKREKFDIATTHFHGSILPIANRAKKALIGGFLGFGADKQAYDVSNTWLKKVGQYSATVIEHTSWSIHLDEKLFQLTLLQATPEAFLNAQNEGTANHQLIKKYVGKLTALKESAKDIKVNKNNSNLIESLDEFQQKASDTHKKFKKLEENISSQVIAAQAETVKYKGFFGRLFGWHKAAEKKQIELQNFQQYTLPVLMKSIETIVESDLFTKYKTAVPFIEARSNVTEVMRNLVNHPNTVADAQVSKLHEEWLANFFSPQIKGKTSKAKHTELRQIFRDLEEKVKANIENLNPNNTNALKKQFTFLAKVPVLALANGTVKGISVAEPNQIRETIVKFIEDKIRSFTDSQQAINFITLLQAADPRHLSNNLKNMIQNRLAEFSAGQNVSDFSAKLLNGSLDSAAIPTLREAVKTALQSELLHVRQQAEDFISNLAKTIKQNIDSLLLSPESEEAKKARADLVNQFAFINAKATQSIDGFEKLDEIRKNAIQIIAGKFSTFNDPNNALHFIANLKKAAPGGLGEVVVRKSNELQGLPMDDFIAAQEKEYTAWKLMNEAVKQFNETKQLDQAIHELKEAAKLGLKSDIAEFKKTTNSFIATLRETIKQDITLLDTNEKDSEEVLIIRIRKIFAFYADIDELAVSRKEIRNHTKKLLDEQSSPEKAASFIAKLYQVGETNIKIFDAKLADILEEAKTKHEQWNLLTQEFKKITNNLEVTSLTAEQTDGLIKAMLWVTGDKEIELGFLPLFLQNFLKLGGKKSELKEFVEECLKELTQVIKADLPLLKSDSKEVDNTTRLRLLPRLKLLSSANVLYSETLQNARNEIVTLIKADLLKLNANEFKRYLPRLETVWPEKLNNDTDLSSTITEVKNRFLEEKLSVVNETIAKKVAAKRKKLTADLEFLKTGDRSLWTTIKEKVTLSNSTELTPDNLAKWGNQFINTYIKDLLDVIETVTAENPDDAALIKQIVKESVVKEVEAVAQPLTRELVEKISPLGQFFNEKDQPFNVSLFMFRYMFVAKFRENFGGTETLDQGAKKFIHVFHDVAQHEGKFTTELVSELPLTALDAMYETWEKDKAVTLVAETNSQFELKEDVIGEVTIDNNNRIRVPRYLLVEMVLELLTDDFNALLNGKTVDKQTLVEKLKFVLPKLAMKQVYEKEFDSTADGQALRLALQHTFTSLENPSITYKELIGLRVPQAVTKRSGILGMMDSITSPSLAEAEKIIFADFRNKLQAIITNTENQVVDCGEEENEKERIALEIATLDDRIRAAKDEQAKAPEKRNRSIARARTSEELTRELTDSFREILLVDIDNLTQYRKQLVNRKNELTQKIFDKKKSAENFFLAQKHNIDNVKALFEKEITLGTNLEELLIYTDRALLNKFTPTDAKYFISLKQFFIARKELERNANLINEIADLKEKLNNSDSILDFIREFPTSVINQIFDKEAEDLRRLQYRFGKNRCSTLAHLLSKENISSMTQASRSNVANVNAQFPSAPKAKAQLKELLMLLAQDEDTFNQFVAVLESSGAAMDKDAITNYFYSLMEKSEPVKMGVAMRNVG